MRPHHEKTDGAKLKNKLGLIRSLISFSTNDDRPNIKPKAIIRVMPLFIDKTASTPMGGAGLHTDVFS